MYFSAAFVLAALPFLAQASPMTKIKGVRVPISKRSNTTGAKGEAVDAAKLRAQLSNIKGKYDATLSNFEKNTGNAHPLASGRTASKRATGSEGLTDSSEELWYGSIEIGSSGTSFTIDFDTGSSDLFVPSSSCGSCGNHQTYSPGSSSSDLGKTFSLSYGDGSTTSGEQYSDTVTVAGLTANPQTLGSATSYSSSFQNGPTDGLMGLAWPQISSYPATPFFNTLINQGTVSQGQFGFYLAEGGSELFLGGADTSKYSGSLDFNSVTQQGYWQINMDSVNANGNQAVTGLSAIIDSGTTLIVGDSDNVANFYASVPGSQDASSTVGQGFYTFPCNSVPSVSATFNGVTYDISSQYFNLGQASSGSSECVGAIVSGNEGFWIMGDVFMRNVYTVFDFDNSQVGFASL